MTNYAQIMADLAALDHTKLPTHIVCPAERKRGRLVPTKEALVQLEKALAEELKVEDWPTLHSPDGQPLDLPASFVKSCTQDYNRVAEKRRVAEERSTREAMAERLFEKECETFKQCPIPESRPFGVFKVTSPKQPPTQARVLKFRRSASSPVATKYSPIPDWLTKGYIYPIGLADQILFSDQPGDYGLLASDGHRMFQYKGPLEGSLRNYKQLERVSYSCELPWQLRDIMEKHELTKWHCMLLVDSWVLQHFVIPFARLAKIVKPYTAAEVRIRFTFCGGGGRKLMMEAELGGRPFFLGRLPCREIPNYVHPEGSAPPCAELDARLLYDAIEGSTGMVKLVLDTGFAKLQRIEREDGECHIIATTAPSSSPNWRWEDDADGT